MKGETDLGQLSVQVSTRDLPGQMTLKYRQDGQGKEDEYEHLTEQDYKKELEGRERKAREERNKEKHYKVSGSSAGSIISGQIMAGGGASGRSGTGRRNIDADDVLDDSDDSSDDEDETADLLNELNKIKAEREEERKIEDVKKQEEEERIRTENILSGNPLLAADSKTKKSTAVKRRWDDDVVFKNCARQEPEKKKNFVNDTIRSDFHRRFMYKYIK